MINIQILDETIDPVVLQRQVQSQIIKVRTLVANVSTDADEFRRLYMAI